MLLSFWLENFRSYHKPHIFSLVPRRRKGDSKGIVNDSRSSYRALSAIAVFGPNAGGKSNLCYAIALLKHLVVNSATKFGPTDKLPAEPYELLARRDFSKTVKLGAEFVTQGIRYELQVNFTEDEIELESLVAYPRGRPCRLYIRESDSPPVFGAEMLIGKETKKVITQACKKKNTLLISAAAQLGISSIIPVYEWFASGLIANRSESPGIPDSFIGYTIRSMVDPDKRTRISNFMKAADVGLGGLEVEELESPGVDALSPEASTDSVRRRFVRPVFLHKIVNDDSMVRFSADQESDGTLNLLKFAGPLIDTLEAGRTMVIDELDSSLHPFLVRKIVDSFCSEQNTGAAQLIFTTHETSLMERGILSRDQIWFAEKDITNSSRLYPLSVFRPRKEEAIRDGYMHGRYCGIPVIEDWSLS